MSESQLLPPARHEYGSDSCGNGAPRGADVATRENLFEGAVRAEWPRAQGTCRLLLPKVIYAVAGQETNVYFDNIVLAPYPGRYLFDVTCERGTQHEKRWFWTPHEERGDYLWHVEVRDLDDNVLAEGSSIIRVTGREAGHSRPFRLLCIGDSLTAASIYTGELLKLFNVDGVDRLSLMGTQHRAEFASANRHEGYSGWRYEHFTTRWQPDAAAGTETNVQSSPFLYLRDGVPELDAGRYLADRHGGEQPDFVTLFLGINDLFLATGSGREEAVETMTVHAQALVTAIREAAPKAVIGVITPTPPSVSQDSFGETNGALQTRRGYRRNLWAGLERLMQVFGNREEHGIYIVPAYHNLDCENNYPMVERQLSARNSAKVMLCNNEVHPAESGYLQIADSIYGWLNWQLETLDDSMD